MAKKYFVYKTREDFQLDMQRLGIEVPLESKFESLFRPVQFGPCAAKNSAGIHPMEGCDGTLDGKPDELTFRRYDRFARGGCALLWGEATAVLEEGRMNTRQLWLTEANLAQFAELVKKTRAAHREAWGSDEGLCFGIQLTHSGRYCYAKPMLAQHDPMLDAATFLDPITKKTIIPKDYPLVSDAYLERLEDAYVTAAKLAVEAGFDFIDLKQCHRYLLSELLASHTQDGHYGGSFENRTRFIRNIIGKIRAHVPAAVLTSRINVFDGVPYMKDPQTGLGVPRPGIVTPYRGSFGVTPINPFEPELTEPKKLIGLIRDLGVVLLNVSMGNPYSNPHIGRPADTPPLDGYESPEHCALGVHRHYMATEELQKAFPDVPMMGTGYSWLQWLMCDSAEANLRRGRCQIAGFGRGALAYPDFMRDLADGKGMVKAKVCITVSYCTALMRFKHNPQRQYETGCVPRDSYYAALFQDANKKYRELQKNK